MSAETSTRRFSEQTIQQVRLDSRRAMTRARYCDKRSQVVHLRCIDDHPETERHFGNQLWYFEGIGVDEYNRRGGIYGVIEYSVQFGLQELVEDGVFDSEYERDRFRRLYDQEMRGPNTAQPAHRWLVAGLIVSTMVTLGLVLFRTVNVG
ncbi:MAG: hypothetical protein AAGA03_19390 [Planctomycetota bacterium]